MLFDTHIHSEMSTDSKARAVDIISKAEKLGLGVIFTEHFDAEAGGDASYFKVDTKKYLEQYAEYRSENVLLGIEIGLTDTSHDINKKMAEAHDFDFVLGSVHMIDGIDIYKDFNSGTAPKLTCEKYLNANIDMIEMCDCYDSLGHIDYPARYTGFEGKVISFEVYKEKYITICKGLLKKNKIIEVNSRIMHIPEHYENLHKIYKCYYEQGGRFVTVGSDAHAAQSVGNSFDLALKMISEIGLTPVYFEKRKMLRCEL